MNATVSDAAGCVPWYPTGLIDMLTLRGGRRLLLRPILPQDDRLLAELINRSSIAARRHRFPSAVDPVSAEQLQRLTGVDYRQHMALVVTTQEGGAEVLIAEARYIVAEDGDSAEFVLMVDEQWQRRGVGSWLMMALSRAAADAGVNWLRAEVMAGNGAMRSLLERYRFYCRPDSLDPRILHVETRARALNARRPAGPSRRRFQWMPRWLSAPAAASRY